jgi:hypothetical protein
MEGQARYRTPLNKNAKMYVKRKPAAVVNYNKNMGGVATNYSVLHSYKIM